MTTPRPGERVEQGALISEIDFAPFRMRVATDRYACPDHHQRERERLAYFHSVLDSWVGEAPAG